MPLDKTAVAHIAALARIEVPDAELAALAGELSQILHWVERLAEVDTSAVEPMSSVVKMSLKRRPDVVTDGGIRDRILANAPETAQGFFAVPKVIE
ncbi:MAG TPA: Asp-tRNA(Asn)/Glu-tRNA(Gln) amidotransferase subunit GatC [Dongiaceae bacterium]|nr:Asp-tRNA(Asn)/Glu-tRNA(Gln) amidotransferase subunit GatC [Dongiaceae bacterium]